MSSSARKPIATAVHNVDYAEDFPEEPCFDMLGGTGEY
jgi:hypothetical protein